MILPTTFTAWLTILSTSLAPFTGLVSIGASITTSGANNLSRSSILFRASMAARNGCFATALPFFVRRKVQRIACLLSTVLARGVRGVRRNPTRLQVFGRRERPAAYPERSSVRETVGRRRYAP